MTTKNLISLVVMSAAGIVLVLGCTGGAVQNGKEAAKPITVAPVASPSATPEPTPDRAAEAQKHLKEFEGVTRKTDPKGDIVKSSKIGGTPDQLVITVASQWHYEPYQMRLQSAQMLWKVWAGIHSPNEPDKARIKVVDLVGNEVGGSRVIAGSMIWVND